MKLSDESRWPNIMPHRRNYSRSSSPEDRRRSPRRRRSRSDSYDRRRRYSSRSPRPRRQEARVEELNPGNNLYVANLSFDTKEQDLEAHFSKCGALKETRIVSDPYTKESKGFGFVTFERNEDADQAIIDLDKTELQGRSISVQKAKRSKPYAPTPGGYRGPMKTSSGGYQRHGRSPSPMYSRRRSRSRSYSRGRR
jgi:transformer-2 protein